MKTIGKVMLTIAIVSMVLVGCTKKTNKEEVMLKGKDLLHGLWVCGDFRMPKFLGINKKFKYPDFFMYIDTKKGEILIRFVYDDEKKDYKVRIEFDEEKIKNMGDSVTAKVINDKGVVREIEFTGLNTYKELGTRNNFYCQFTDAKGEEKYIGKLFFSSRGTFMEENMSDCFSGWESIDDCSKQIRDTYEIEETEAEIDWGNV